MNNAEFRRYDPKEKKFTPVSPEDLKVDNGKDDAPVNEGPLSYEGKGKRDRQVIDPNMVEQVKQQIEQKNVAEVRKVQEMIDGMPMTDLREPITDTNVKAFKMADVRRALDAAAEANKVEEDIKGGWTAKIKKLFGGN